MKESIITALIYEFQRSFIEKESMVYTPSLSEFFRMLILMYPETLPLPLLNYNDAGGKTQTIKLGQFHLEKLERLARANNISKSHAIRAILNHFCIPYIDTSHINTMPRQQKREIHRNKKISLKHHSIFNIEHPELGMKRLPTLYWGGQGGQK